MSQSLFTVKEASSFLKISHSTIYRYSGSGLIPHIKKNFGLRFRKEDLEKWMEQDKIKGAIVDNILKNALTNAPPVAIDKAKGGQEVARAIKSRHNYGYGAVYIRKTKLGIPRFYIDYYDRNRRRIQKLVRNATNWQEAHEVLKNAVLKEHFEECGIKESKQPIKFKEFADMFVENYSKVNKRSWRDDFYRLRKCSGFFGNVYLYEISSFDVEMFKSTMIKEGLSKTTVNHYLKILRRMFNIGIDWGYADVNPVKHVKLYSEKDSRKERILTEEEEVRLFEAASERLRPILTVALNTGMRRGEILNLTWNRVDLERRLIRVVKTKSGKDRSIPINDDLFKVLNDLRGKRNGEYLFPNPRTGRPFKAVRKSFANAIQEAEIKGLRFHDLRHTFASRLVGKGVDIVRVKELLGHSSVRITERYTHSCQEEKRKAVELLCRRSHKEAEKQEELLHIRYTGKRKKESLVSSSLFSVN